MSSGLFLPRDERDRAAREMFLDALDSFLPVRAIHELEMQARAEPHGDIAFVRGWVRRWGLEAQCVMQKALSNIAGRRRHANWPMQFGADLTRDELRKHRYGSHRLSLWSQRIRQHPDPDVKEGIESFPTEETLAQFLFRAKRHWHTRVEIGVREHDFVEMPSKADLERNICWLLQRQVSRQSWAQIARTAANSGGAVTVDAVRKSVASIARTLNIRQIVVRRGRPSSRKPEY